GNDAEMQTQFSHKSQNEIQIQQSVFWTVVIKICNQTIENGWNTQFFTHLGVWTLKDHLLA
ncbi:MAG: hypothetical protein AAGB06_02855, partial [Verrucomicrobiota bacterium]